MEIYSYVVMLLCMYKYIFWGDQCMCVVASRWIAKRLLPEIENKRDTED